MNLVKNWGLFENLGNYLTGNGISIETVEVVYKMVQVGPLSVKLAGKDPRRSFFSLFAYAMLSHAGCGINEKKRKKSRKEERKEGGDR